VTTTAILHAASTGEGLALPLVLAGYPKEIEGKPCFYRRKEVIKAGDWFHRGKREPFSVPVDRIDKWVAEFNRRAAAGVKVPITTHHTENPTANDTLGYAVALKREGESLFADVQLIDDDALTLAARNDVSICVMADGIDAKGNPSGEHLHHIALTPNPNQPHLGPFVSIAASAAGTPTEAPVFELNCGTGSGGFHAGNTCGKGDGTGGTGGESHKVTKESSYDPSQFKKVKRGRIDAARGGAFLGNVGTSLPDAISAAAYNTAKDGKTRYLTPTHNGWTPSTDAPPKFTDAYIKIESTGGKIRVAKYERQVGSMALSGDFPMTDQQLAEIRDLVGADNVTDETAIPLLVEWGKKQKQSTTSLSASVETLKGERDAAKQQVLSLSADAPRKPDALTLSMYADNIAAKRESAVASSAVSEAEAKAFDALISDAEGKPNGLALSASAGGRPLAFALWDTVAKLGKSGVRTGNAVNRGTPADPPNHKTLDLSADGKEQTPEQIREEARQEAAAWQDRQLTARGLK
jgi:hypothetical protein